MIDVALDCIRRGWFVFPCVPKDKRPLAGLAPRGFLDATNDEDTVRRWWAAKPDANVGIATGPSGLVVVDVDHGLTEDSEWPFWLCLPPTYTVRTGRRPEFGVQLYFRGDGNLRNGSGWSRDGLSGDIRAEGGYVLAAGSIHPSGAEYEVLLTRGLQDAPEWVKELAPEKQQFDPATAVDDATADGWKTWLLEYCEHYGLAHRDFEKRVPNGWWLGIECPWRDEHSSGDGAESSTVLGILDGKVAFLCSHGTCGAAKRTTDVFKAERERIAGDWLPEPGAEIGIVIGGKTAAQAVAESAPRPVGDWREHYHTRDEMENTPPVSFLIENFLPYQSITAIAAPVRQRKSLIALNVAHSLCSGEPLFGRFAVTEKPTRVLYLCPEMGIRSFVERARKIGLLKYAGESFFCRTMNMQGVLELKDLTADELTGAVVIIDTLIRYQKGGEENSSKDMAALSAQAFRLIEAGAGAVIALHHSQKNNSEQEALTLENTMRGSGELGASMTNAWATRLQDPNDEYGSRSYLQNVKPRDYKPDPKAFEVECSEETCRMTFVESDVPVKLQSRFTGNRDGKDDQAEDIIKANMDKSGRVIVDMLEKAGCKRSRDWVGARKNKLAGSGASHVSD